MNRSSYLIPKAWFLHASSIQKYQTKLNLHGYANKLSGFHGITQRDKPKTKLTAQGLPCYSKAIRDEKWF